MNKRFLFILLCFSVLMACSNETEKTKAARSDIAKIAQALLDYTFDKSAPPQSSDAYNTSSDIYKALCPTYIGTLPIKDPWGNDYLIFCGLAINGQYGIGG